MITPQEHKVIGYLQSFRDHNRMKFPEASVTSAMIGRKFRLSREGVRLLGKRMETKELISRAKGKGAAFWELV